MLLGNEISKCAPSTLLSSNIEALTYSNGVLYGVNRDGLFIYNENLFSNLLSNQADSFFLTDSYYNKNKVSFNKIKNIPILSEILWMMKTQDDKDFIRSWIRALEEENSDDEDSEEVPEEAPEEKWDSELNNIVKNVFCRICGAYSGDSEHICNILLSE